MIAVSIRRLSDARLLFDRASITETAWERMRGLLGRPPLAASEALLIRPCSSVHMFGMRYALDITYLNKSGEVIKTVTALQPMSMSACFGAAVTIEMPVNSIAVHNIKIGDVITWEENE